MGFILTPKVLGRVGMISGGTIACYAFSVTVRYALFGNITAWVGTTPMAYSTAMMSLVVGLTLFWFARLAADFEYLLTHKSARPGKAQTLLALISATMLSISTLIGVLKQ